jgi:hypothetical protein
VRVDVFEIILLLKKMARQSPSIPHYLLAITSDTKEIKHGINEELAAQIERDAIEKWGRKVVDTCKEYINNDRNKKNRPYFQVFPQFDQAYITDKSSKIENVRRTPLFHNKHPPDLVYQNYIILKMAPFFLPINLYRRPIKFPKDAVTRLNSPRQYKGKNNYWWEDFDPIDLFAQQYNCKYDTIKSWLLRNSGVRGNYIVISSMSYVYNQLSLFTPGELLFLEHEKTKNRNDPNSLPTDKFGLRKAKDVTVRGESFDPMLLEKYQIKLYFGMSLITSVPDYPNTYKLKPIQLKLSFHEGVVFPNIQDVSVIGYDGYMSRLDELGDNVDFGTLKGCYIEPYAEVLDDNTTFQGSVIRPLFSFRN